MADRTVADIIADECIHDDADLATLRAMVHEVERLREAVGGLTANVKRWRNRASAERLKRQRWRKRALAAEAENERLRAELRTVTERSEAMKARYKKAIALCCKKANALWRGENERLREALRAAGMAPSVVAAIAKGEPPRPCPAGHGDQCCGYPAACEASLSGSPTQETR